MRLSWLLANVKKKRIGQCQEDSPADAWSCALYFEEGQLYVNYFAYVPQAEIDALKIASS